MRRLTLVGLGIVVLLGIVHALVWQWACGQVGQQVQAWAAAQRAQGWTVALGPTHDAGWPLAAMVRIDGFAVTSPPATSAPGAAGGPDGTVYGAEAVEVGVSALHPREMVARPLGVQHLHPAGGPDIGFTTERAALTTPLMVPPPEMDLMVEGLHTSLPAADGGAPAPVVVRQLRVHADGLAPGAAPLGVTLQAGPVDLPPGLKLAVIGPQITRLALDAVITHPAANVAAWRDGGGSLTLRQLALDWGTLSLTGSATLHLDGALQPAGSGQARLVGTAETLDALTTAQLIAPRAATAAKAILALLSRPQDNGPPVVAVPLAIQDRTLRVGSFPVARLPAIAW